MERREVDGMLGDVLLCMGTLGRDVKMAEERDLKDFA